MGTVSKFSSHSLNSASTTTESREYGDNLTIMLKKGIELGLFLDRYTPDRMKLVVHLNEIADEMEETHQSVAKQKAFGNIVGIGGAGLAIVGTVALAPFCVGVGTVAGLVGLAVKLTSPSKEEMHGKWKEVKRAIERDTEAWGYVKKTVEEIQQLVQQNEKLTEEKKWAIPVGLVLEFETAKGQVEKVILRLKVLWLNVPDEQKLEAVMQAIACTMSAIMAAGGETIMTGTKVGQALTNAEDVAQTGAKSVEQVTKAGTTVKSVKQVTIVAETTVTSVEQVTKAGTTVQSVEQVTKAGTAAKSVEQVTKAGTAVNSVEQVTKAGTTVKSVEQVTKAGTAAKSVEQVTKAGTTVKSVEQVTKAGTTVKSVEQVTKAGTAAKSVEQVTKAGTTVKSVEQVTIVAETALESVEQVTTAGTGASIKEYAVNALKTNHLSTAAKISVALNVVSMIVDVYEFAQNYKQFDLPGENAKRLRALATQLEELFKQ